MDSKRQEAYKKRSVIGHQNYNREHVHKKKMIGNAIDLSYNQKRIISDLQQRNDMKGAFQDNLRHEFVSNLFELDRMLNV